MNNAYGGKEYVAASIHELCNYVEDMDYEKLKQVVNLIIESEQKGGRVHITGVGKPGHVAGYVASLFSSTGTPAYFLDAGEAIHGSSGQVKKEDIVIAISNSGMTKELKDTVQTLITNQATVVGISGNKDSWLARNSAYHIYAGVHQEGDPLNKPPRASVLVEIVALQVLSVMLQNQKKLNMDKYYQWHPGGSLGESIRQEKQKK